MSLLGIDIGGTKVPAARSWIRPCNSVEWRPLCLCTKPNDAQILVIVYRLLDF